MILNELLHCLDLPYFPKLSWMNEENHYGLTSKSKDFVKRFLNYFDISADRKTVLSTYPYMQYTCIFQATVIVIFYAERPGVGTANFVIAINLYQTLH
jgi:hypothetical protein